jgi:hypothetical protein
LHLGTKGIQGWLSAHFNVSTAAAWRLPIVFSPEAAHFYLNPEFELEIEDNPEARAFRSLAARLAVPHDLGDAN